MAEWNRRQFLSGLMVAVGVKTSTAAAEAMAVVAPTVAPPAASRPQLPAHKRALQGTPRTSAAPGTLTAHPHASSARPATEVSAFPPRQMHFAPDGTAHEVATILPPGLRFGRWRIVAVHPVKLGAIPVVLETRTGLRFQVDLLRRDPHVLARRGIAETRHYALYLANVGRGNTPTVEEHGLGLMWLAALLRTREHRVERPPLLTLRDRLGHFPHGAFNSITRRT